LIVTMKESVPVTMVPLPDTPLAFWATIVKLMVGEGDAEVAAEAPPHAESATPPIRAARARLSNQAGRITSSYYIAPALGVAMVQPGGQPLQEDGVEGTI
jgi:hypothetical protein